MAKELNIPEQYRLTLNRLIGRIPLEFREDEALKKTALIYLKLGGEKLARAGIKALTTPFSEKFILRKMQLNDDESGKVADSNEGDTPTEDTAGETVEAIDDTSKGESVDVDTDEADANPSPDTPGPE